MITALDFVCFRSQSSGLTPVAIINYLSVNLQSLSQHGPSLGEHSAKGFRLQRFSVAQAACSSGDNVVGPCLKNRIK